MVRSVLAEVEYVENGVDELLSQSSAAQTGLLIGKTGVPSRDHIYALLPTPLSDTTADVSASGSASKKASKGETPLEIDPEWVGEHTRQVSRMLPGGLAVLGIFAICSEAALKAAGGQLWEALTATAAAAGQEVASAETPVEWLLLHVSRQPRKFTCRSGPVGLASASGFQSLRPCELKFGHNLNSLHCLQASYRVDIRLQIPSNTVTSLRANIESAIAAEVAKLESTDCTIDGSLADVAQSLAATSETNSVDMHPTQDVIFFSRPSWGAEVGSKLGEEPRSNPVSISGHVALRGCIHLRAYSHPKQAVGTALGDLKGDLSRTLKARLSLLVDEAERAEEELETDATSAGGATSAGSATSAESATSAGGRAAAAEGATSARGPGTSAGTSDAEFSHPLLERAAASEVRRFGEGLPRRVLVPWLGGVRLSEYLIGTESVAEAAERCRDMLGASYMGGNDILEVEKVAVAEKVAGAEKFALAEKVAGVVTRAVPEGAPGKWAGTETETGRNEAERSGKGVPGSMCSQATLAAAVGAMAAASLAVGLAYTLR